MGESEINPIPQEVIKKPEGKWIEFNQKNIDYLNENYAAGGCSFIPNAMKFPNTEQEVGKNITNLLSTFILTESLKQGVEIKGSALNENNENGDQYICFSCDQRNNPKAKEAYLKIIDSAINEINPILSSINSKVSFPKTR